MGVLHVLLFILKIIGRILLVILCLLLLILALLLFVPIRYKGAVSTGGDLAQTRDPDRLHVRIEAGYLFKLICFAFELRQRKVSVRLRAARKMLMGEREEADKERETMAQEADRADGADQSDQTAQTGETAGADQETVKAAQEDRAAGKAAGTNKETDNAVETVRAEQARSAGADSITGYTQKNLENRDKNIDDDKENAHIQLDNRESSAEQHREEKTPPPAPAPAAPDQGRPAVGEEPPQKGEGAGTPPESGGKEGAAAHLQGAAQKIRGLCESAKRRLQGLIRGRGGAAQRTAGRDTADQDTVDQGTVDRDTVDQVFTASEDIASGKRPSLAERLHSFIGGICAALNERGIAVWQRLGDFIFAALDAIDGRLERLERKIEDMLERLERIRPLVDWVSRGYYSWLLHKALRMLSHFRVRRISGHLRYGTGRPDLTGMAGGVLLAILPAGAENFALEPDFYETALDAEMTFSGRIRLCHAAWLALCMLCKRDTWMMLKRIKGSRRSREEKHG